MRALRLEADWAPRRLVGMARSERERLRSGRCGAEEWRNPSMALVETPDPNASGTQIVLKVEACGICGSDLHLIETDQDGYILYPGLVNFPVIPGHELSGEVVAVGDRVSRLQIGDLVTVEEIHWCGRCDVCRGGNFNHCTDLEEMGFTRPGGIAQYVSADEKYCWSLNGLAGRRGRSVALELGSLVEPCAVAYNAIFVNCRAFRPGNVVVVIGCGPIGLASIALCRLAGASHVIALEIADERAKLAEVFGATAVINPTRIDPLTTMLDVTTGRRADLIVEASGAPDQIPGTLALLNVRGTIVLVGKSQLSGVLRADRLEELGGTVVGSQGHAGNGVFGSVIALLEAGRLEPQAMITLRVPGSSAPAAFGQLKDRRHGKVTILTGQ